MNVYDLPSCMIQIIDTSQHKKITRLINDKTPTQYSYLIVHFGILPDFFCVFKIYLDSGILMFSFYFVIQSVNFRLQSIFAQSVFAIDA